MNKHHQVDDTREFLKILLRDGAVRDPGAKLVALTGGVSSDIYRVEDGERVFVVKRALEKLKVQADWVADTKRNLYEQAFLRYVGKFLPEAVPRILYANTGDGYFCMEYLDGFHNWKTDLLAGRYDHSLGRKAGELMGAIHRQSWNDTEAARLFDSMDLFDELRIDPYLRATADKHPDLAEAIHTEASRLRHCRQCLMHGDFSPKNLLHLNGRMVILDCEVACFADAAFDLAFLLNHCLLKALYHAPAQTSLKDLFATILKGYRKANPEHHEEVEAATLNLLPILMLARVDGKSPVEYLDTADKKNCLRTFTKARILRPPETLHGFAREWFNALAVPAIPRA